MSFFHKRQQVMELDCPVSSYSSGGCLLQEIGTVKPVQICCRIPDSYYGLDTCSDYWSSYADVFDPDTHQSVGKHTGLTNHVERFNATARHRLVG
ncbi:MAG: hypothetical protein U1E94_00185 [Agitococcus sp.]